MDSVGNSSSIPLMPTSMEIQSLLKEQRQHQQQLLQENVKSVGGGGVGVGNSDGNMDRYGQQQQQLYMRTSAQLQHPLQENVKLVGGSGGDGGDGNVDRYGQQQSNIYMKPPQPHQQPLPSVSSDIMSENRFNGTHAAVPQQQTQQQQQQFNSQPTTGGIGMTSTPAVGQALAPAMAVNAQYPQQMPGGNYFAMPGFFNGTQSSHFANLLAHSNGNDLNRRKRKIASDLDATSLQDFKQVQERYATKELKEAFERVQQMSLIDDLNTLNNLFTHESLFHDTDFFLHLLNQMYLQKYPELFDEYQSLHTYMSTVTAFLLYRSLSALKQATFINGSRNQEIQLNRRPVLNFKHLVFTRKKVTSNASSANNETTPNAENDCDEEETRIIKNHPFLRTKFYQEHMDLFAIGGLTKYCVPSDFAVLFTSVRAEQVVKYVKQGERCDYDGITISFSLPVVLPIKSRQVNKDNRNFTYLNVSSLQTVADLIRDMTLLTTNNEPFTLGTKKEMNLENITLGRNAVEKMTQFGLDNDFHFVFMANFNGIKMGNLIELRGYANSIYKIPEAIATASDNQNYMDSRVNQSKFREHYIRQCGALQRYFLEYGFESDALNAELLHEDLDTVDKDTGKLSK